MAAPFYGERTPALLDRLNAVRMLIATAGVLSPDPVAAFAGRLAGPEGSVRVMTVIEVPRSFLDQIRGEGWHPLSEASPAWSTEEDALIARYVEERGHRLTDPLIAALKAQGIEATVTYLEGEDPAATILAAAEEMEADVIVLGATKHLFDEWESVSARVLRDTRRPVLVVPTAPRTVDEMTE
jgi:nucleotide-binding universal stress UspA family protein